MKILANAWSDAWRPHAHLVAIAYKKERRKPGKHWQLQLNSTSKKKTTFAKSYTLVLHSGFKKNTAVVNENEDHPHSRSGRCPVGCTANNAARSPSSNQ